MGPGNAQLRDSVFTVEHFNHSVRVDLAPRFGIRLGKVGKVPLVSTEVLR